MKSGGDRLRVLVTGSNRGLGLGIANAYSERGDEVIAVCRTASAELSALKAEIIEAVDLGDTGSVMALRDRIGEREIDVLVCNAGINKDAPGLDSIELENMAEVIDINAIGCVRLVLALLPRMRAGSKIALVGTMGLSPLGVLGLPPVSNYAYRMSKAALISFGEALGQDVRNRDISVAIVSPGAVRTDMFRAISAKSGAPSSAIDAARDIFEAGRVLRDRMDRLTTEQSPALDQDPEGNPAIPVDLLELLRQANRAQIQQAKGVMAR